MVAKLVRDSMVDYGQIVERENIIGGRVRGSVQADAM